jgi:cell division transport system permease protein
MITWLHHQAYALRLAFARLFHSPLASFLSIVAIGLAMALPAGLYRLVSDASSLARPALHEPGITLFMMKDADPAAVRAVWDTLQADPAVKGVHYISSAEALAGLKATPGMENALGSLERNPLPDTFVVQARDVSPTALEALRKKLAGLDKVEKAQMDGEWARRLAAMLDWSYRMVTGLAIILGITLVSVIVNTVRLQILSAREEIEVTHLIGATRRYIRRPFLYFGCLQALLGACFAAIVVIVGTYKFNLVSNELFSLFGFDFHVRNPTPQELLMLLGGGGTLGWVSAYLALTAYLPKVR